MKKRAAVVILSVVLIAAASCGIVSRRGKEPEPDFVLTYAENQPADYPTSLGAMKFAELVEEKTGGRIKIIVRPEGVMGDEKGVIRQLQFGGIDFTRASLSSLGDSMPGMNVLQLPYLYRNAEHMWQVLDGEIGDRFLADFAGTNMVGLSWYDAGARNFYNNVGPIRAPEDLKGLKIRVQESELMADMVEALGAEAAPIAYADVYSALETGVVDGAENNWSSYEAAGHYEVAKYFTLDEHTRVPEVQLCAQATWDKLSEEDRRIIAGCARESACYERKLWVESEKESARKVRAQGVEVTELTQEEREAFRKATEILYDTYCLDDKEVIEEIKRTGT